MKHKNIIYAAMLLLLLAIGMQGCRDDLSTPDRPEDGITYDGIVLRIPNPKGMAEKATRSASNAEYIDIVEKEGLITSLHLYAFNSQGGNPIHVDLKEVYGDDNSLLLPGTVEGTDYQDFDITPYFQENGGNVKVGPWKLYLVANLEHYTPDNKLPDITKEDDLKEIALNFFSSKGDYLLNTDYITEHGLPLACMPEGIQHGKDINSLTPASNGLVEFPVAGEGVVLANLSFLCSKVRYTLLFDKEKDGSAKDIFKGMTVDFTSASANDIVADGTTVGTDLSSTKENLIRKPLSPISLGEFSYPDNADEYPEEGEEFKSLPALEGNPLPAKRAWQGVLYLPENGSSASTTLSFIANTVKTKTENGKETLTEETGSNLAYSVTLLPEKRDGSNAVKRGYAYDLVARVTKIDNLEISLNVASWTTLALEYALTTPAFLHVDKTDVAVQAGKKSEIWYESNAEISFDSPKFGNIPIYTFEKEGDKIEVGVNSALPTSTFDEILKEENISKYDFFHIIAGNLRKKIDVTPLLLQKFLIVDPDNFTIDVREQKASGNYSGEFRVKIETNIEKFRIDDVNWLQGNPARGENLKIYINTKDDGWEELKFDADYTPFDGQRQLKIVYNNLNSGDAFWNSRQTFQLTVSVDNGDTKPGPGYISPKTVSASVLPSNDNYIIHFRDNEGWTNAHIYVYQCLEMPSYWNKEAWYDGNSYNMASMPVGYEDRSGNPWKVMAALEYSFTGAIAFKGWESYSNNVSLTHYNEEGTRYNEGFWIFSDGGFWDGHGCSWNPSHPESDARYEKGTSVDFCKEYRPTVACKECRQGTGNPSWPGIRMSGKDADGWWTFELTGIATPGKALIMFTDGHEYTNGQKRYPGDQKVGIPLFDYPSKEGWFDLNKNNNTFISTKPGGEGTSTEYTTKRYYFDNSKSNYSQPYIYLYNSNGQINADWPGEKMTEDTETGYWYCDVTVTGEYQSVIFSDGGDSNTQTKSLGVDNSKNLYDKDGAIGNVDENGGNGGGDNPVQPDKNGKLYVKNGTGWADDKLRVYGYAGDEQPFGSWDEMKKIQGTPTTVAGESYLVFNFTKTNTTINLIFSNEGNSGDNQFNGPSLSLANDCYVYAEKDNWNVQHKLLVEDKTNWNCDLYVYGWANNQPELFGEWPGKKLVKEGNYYVTMFNDRGIGYNLIINNNNHFNNGNSDQIQIWVDGSAFSRDLYLKTESGNVSIVTRAAGPLKRTSRRVRK